MNELLAIINGSVMARLRHGQSKTTLTYEEAWRDDADAHPLSLSMPLSAAAHTNGAVEPFLWGLLPDNELVLDRWARQFQVSARNAFRLIANVGEDCAGAVQFVAPERLEPLLAGREEGVKWLKPKDLADRMRVLRDDAAAGRVARDTGQFSLAGAQPKTALLREGRRWGIPSGRVPTTHILKPATRAFDGHAENEHLCLATAKALGLLTANSEVAHFGETSVIVVERFDRHREGDEIIRLHQEDMCQALAVHPSRKYQNDGGPGVKDIVSLLRATVYHPDQPGAPADEAAELANAAEIDVWRFVEAVLFNWLIGGTDAHAKNYSVLIGSHGLVRLAPLYDVASIFGYPDRDGRRAKLAMKIDDKYRLSDIVLVHWERMARDLRIDADRVVAKTREMADALPDALAAEAHRMRRGGIDHPVIEHVLDGVSRHAAAVRRM